MRSRSVTSGENGRDGDDWFVISVYSFLSWLRCGGAGFQFVLCYPLCTVAFENIDKFVSRFRTGHGISPVPPGVVIHEDRLGEVAGAVLFPRAPVRCKGTFGYSVGSTRLSSGQEIYEGGFHGRVFENGFECLPTDAAIRASTWG
jgi:hypothetical protein